MSTQQYVYVQKTVGDNIRDAIHPFDYVTLMTFQEKFEFLNLKLFKTNSK